MFQDYTSQAWTFCDRMDRNALDFRHDDHVEILKWFKPSSTTDDYCSVLALTDDFEGCVTDETDPNTFDCRGKEESLAELACRLKDPSLFPNMTHVLFNFPVDDHDTPIDDYFEGASNEFFTQFNSPSRDYPKTVKTLPVYSTKFDLVQLDDLTGNMTDRVNINADTVHITNPTAMDFRLRVTTRKMIVDKPISMKMSRDQLTTNEALWTMKEEIIDTSGVLMRNRTFGLIEVLDQYQPSTHRTNGVCKPARLNVITDEIDTSQWFDPTALMLQYVCARTLVSTQKNPRLAEDITQFNLGFAYNASIVHNARARSVSQKFLTLKNAFGKV